MGLPHGCRAFLGLPLDLLEICGHRRLEPGSVHSRASESTPRRVASALAFVSIGASCAISSVIAWRCCPIIVKCDRRSRSRCQGGRRRSAARAGTHRSVSSQTGKQSENKGERWK
jgi:hypothetical protein